MSALAMILTVAMMAPGNGPEMESRKVAEPQRLDLSGRWKGTCAKYQVPPMDVEPNFKTWEVTDEGDGRMRIKTRRFTYWGIYVQSGDHLMICFDLDGKSCPSRFQRGDSRCLLILHRVKPRK